MKSCKILIRNLPETEKKMTHAIHVKPTVFLCIIVAIGFVFLFLNKVMVFTGIACMIFAIFAIAVLPDRNLCVFTPDWIALYNQKNQNECMMVYYDEIVSWCYETKNPYDQLTIVLESGESEHQEIFGKRKITTLMRHYAPNKEKKK